MIGVFPLAWLRSRKSQGATRRAAPWGALAADAKGPSFGFRVPSAEIRLKSKRREICSRSRLVRSLVGFQSRRLRLLERRLCDTLGAHFIDGSASRCCAISAARSRAAARTNLARSNQSLFLRSRFGGAKRSALVNIFIFMICPRLVGSCLADDKQILPRDPGHLMAINPSNHAAGDPRSQKRVPIEEANETPTVIPRPPIRG
jgi:hypothetical protein